ncbi:MAG: hypothetical protein EOM67_03195 [Spirochaetia bacterium]|nr:hypothetical protein [Spirochaetia bacterium]
MVLLQQELLEASDRFVQSSSEKKSLYKKAPIYVIHDPSDIRLVEGLIVILKEVLGELSFNWAAGYDLNSLQVNTYVDEKDKILSSAIVVFLATFKSLQNNSLLNLLEFSKVINKATYIIPTKYEETVYGESFSKQHMMMYFEQARASAKIILKIKSPEQKNILRTVVSEEQLK